MPHPEQEHGLMIEVARLNKDLRDSREECARLRADFGHEQKMHFSAERAADKLITEKEHALAAARRECERLRKALNACLDSFQLAHAHKKLSTAADGGIVCACDLARAALAAPMDGEEGKR